MKYLPRISYVPRIFASMNQVPGFFMGILPILLTILSGCASIAPPMGGEKDQTPPQIVSVDPPQKSMQLQADDKIIIRFDEYIEARGLSNALYSSPPLKRTPEVTVNPKSVEIALDTPLLDSTTYTLYLGNGISDFREGNAIDNYAYVFSTGPRVDSARFEGRVVDLLTESTPEKPLFVLAYLASNDTGITTQKPRYLAKTHQDGSFELGHLRSASYRVYVINDQNGNLHWDEGERISFSPEPIRARADTVFPLVFSLFQPVPRETSLLDYKLEHQGKVKLYFNKRLKNFRFSPASDTVPTPVYQVYKHPNQDTISIWFDQPLDTATPFLIQANDSLQDTLILDPTFADSAQTPRRTLSMNQPIPSQFKWYKGRRGRRALTLTFKNPVFWDSTAVIRQYRDTVTLDTLTIEATALPHHLRLPLPEPETSYMVELPDSMFFDAYGNYVKSKYRINVSPADPSEYAVLGLDIALPEDDAFIIQLLSEDGKTVRERVHPENGLFRWTYLKPGSYRIRTILDRNQNGFWDGGVFERRELPEAVRHHGKTIQLRANWEVLEVPIRWLQNQPSAQ